MFYLFICTAILINTLVELSVMEAALLWMTLLCGYLLTSYIAIVNSSARARHKLKTEYRSKIDEIQKELLTIQPGKNKPAVALPNKGKAAAH